MPLKRPIKEQELVLIRFMLQQAGLAETHFVIAGEVDDYEGAVMGSIGLGAPEAVYAGDILQVEYEDEDSTNVVITLTKDTENKLLDLDFWKSDFSRLLKYPTPDKLIVIPK